MLTTVMSQAAADAIIGMVASTFESSETSPGTLRSHQHFYLHCTLQLVWCVPCALPGCKKAELGFSPKGRTAMSVGVHQKTCLLWVLHRKTFLLIRVSY